MKYDDLIEELGDYGPYQKWAYFILCTPSVLKATIVMVAVFIFVLPKYECVGPVPEGVNVTGDELIYEGSQIFWSNLTSSDQCQILSRPKSLWETGNSTEHSGTAEDDTYVTCTKWKYDTSEIESTIATEYNFLCGNAIMNSNLNMGFFVGSLFGGLVFGTLADIVGRKKALMMCICVQIVTGITLYFVTDMVGVAILKSVQGMGGEMFAISASTGMELLGPKRRTFAGMIVEFYWSGGQLLVLLVAYLTRDWRLMVLIFGILAVPFLLLVVFAPESPRWLLDKGRTEEAKKILERIAKSNKTKIPEGALENRDELFTHELSVWTLFTNKTLVIRSCIMFYNWFTVNFLYYGLSLNLDTLAGSIYTNYLISIIVEAAGFLVAILLLERTGRKLLHIVAMFVGSAACMLVAFPVIYGGENTQWIVTTLSMIGKMGMGICYSILYIITVEIFPTVVRNSALGICMIFENVAGMTSPYVADLGVLVDSGSISQALPLMVFGAIGLIAAALSVFLPETLHQPLPETIEDAIQLGSKKSKVVKTTPDSNIVKSDSGSTEQVKLEGLHGN